MFASKAGAKLVVGIDMSNILDQAEKIVRANGFTEDRESAGDPSLETYTHVRGSRKGLS